jgi:hypothetical protein
MLQDLKDALRQLRKRNFPRFAVPNPARSSGREVPGVS